METNEKIQSEILRKTEGSSSAKMAWQSAMDQCRFCGMPKSLIDALVAAFESPSTLKLLCKLVSEDPLYNGSESFDVVWERFRQLRDDSNYDNSQLLKSLECVLAFVREGNVKTKFGTVLGYLTCVEEFAYTSSSPSPLSDIVSQMIEEYGFDG